VYLWLRRFFGGSTTAEIFLNDGVMDPFSFFRGGCAAKEPCPVLFLRGQANHSSFVISIFWRLSGTGLKSSEAAISLNFLRRLSDACC
jgi:hypothetical protein